MEKKQRLWILALLLTLLALPAVPASAAWAEEDGATPASDTFGLSEEHGLFQGGAFRGPQTVPGAPELLGTDWEQGAYQLILRAWENRQSEVVLSSLRIPWSEIQQVWTVGSAVINDHPELFYAHWYGTAYAAQGGSGWIVGRILLKYYDFSYYGLSGIDEARVLFDRAVERALSVVEPGMTDLEKVLALHDYLVTHIAYNWDVATKSDDDRNFWDTYPNRQAATAFGALVNGDAICQSYSLAYKLLLEREGISSIMIGSDAMNHVWNGIQLDGIWYQTDVTWDDPVPNMPGICRHTNFLISDAALEKTNHHDWEQLVTCPDTTYESGWIFNDNNHAVCRRNGEYNYVRNNGNSLISLCHSPTLRAEDGTVLHENPGGYFYQGVVWKDGYLYYIPYADDGNYRLLRCSLDSGKVTQLGAFSFVKTASPDGAYSASRDGISLRLSQDGAALEVFSPTRRSVIARFSVPPALPAWEGLTADGVSILGIARGEGGTGFAGLSWTPAASPTDLSLLAAFFRGGRMQAVRSAAVPAVSSWASRPELKLAEVDLAGLPPYDELRLFLLREDGSWQPFCPAGRG